MLFFLWLQSAFFWTLLSSADKLLGGRVLSTWILQVNVATMKTYKCALTVNRGLYSYSNLAAGLSDAKFSTCWRVGSGGNIPILWTPLVPFKRLSNCRNEGQFNHIATACERQLLFVRHFLLNHTMQKAYLPWTCRFHWYLGGLIRSCRLWSRSWKYKVYILACDMCTHFSINYSVL